MSHLPNFMACLTRFWQSLWLDLCTVPAHCDVAHSLTWAAVGGDANVSPVILVWQYIMSIWKRGEKDKVVSENS